MAKTPKTTKNATQSLNPDEEQNEQFSADIKKADEEFSEDTLERSLKGQPLDTEKDDPAGRLMHFLRQLAKLCHLRGDMIPRAQELLLQKFFLNRRDRHHLKQMSNAHALRSEGALKDGNVRLALLERIEAWQRMPRDLSLLLDVTEAYIEPENFAEQWSSRGKDEQSEKAEEQSEKAEEQSEKAEEQPVKVGKFARRKRRSSARKKQEKAARQLFQLSAWQHRKQALNYLKKAVELSVGLKEESIEELDRLEKLQEHYPQINWQRYIQRIEALKGKPRRKWPWALLILAILALFYLIITYVPWQIWKSTQQQSLVQEDFSNEQKLLEQPVPVKWEIEQDKNFTKVIQKSQRLKLAQFYAYEVQGHIRVKSQNGETAVAQPFELYLDYEHRGQKYRKVVRFSYSSGKAPNESERAIVLEGDTMLFREVFRLPDEPAADDLLRAKVAITGPAPSLDAFNVSLPSIDSNGKEVPQLELGLRQKLERSDGTKLRMLGYDFYLKNNSQRPLDFLELRLNWVDEEGPQAKELSPVLLQRDYTIISPSGSNLPGASQTTRRLWLEIPEDLNYAPEDWTPQVRILDFAYQK